MTLAIVGSVSLAGHAPTLQLVLRIIGQFRDLYPDLHVISGGAAGVDTIAHTAADALNIPFHAFNPTAQNWAAFKIRNMMIAEECDVLVRIVTSDSKTYGSGWTRDRAHELGKPTTERIVTR